MSTILPFFGCGLMIVSLGFVLTFWFRAMRAFDKLLQYECENLPDQWEKDCQPRGIFWKPLNKKIRWQNVFLGEFVIFRLLFTTPAWVKENVEPVSYIKDFRKFSLLWSAGILVWFIVIFPSIVIIFTPRS